MADFFKKNKRDCVASLVLFISEYLSLSNYKMHTYTLTQNLTNHKIRDKFKEQSKTFIRQDQEIGNRVRAPKWKII